MILQKYLEIPIENDVSNDVCDVDRSGFIDLTDVQLVLQYYLEIITEFPDSNTPASETPTVSEPTVSSGNPATSQPPANNSENPVTEQPPINSETPSNSEEPEDNRTEFVVENDNIYMFDESLDDGEVIIPAEFTYEGTDYKVTSISSHAFWDCTELKSVTIADGVKVLMAEN